TQLRRGLPAVPRAELGADDDRLAPGAEGRDGGGERVALDGPFGQALPVEEVDAPVDRREDVLGGDHGPAVGGEAEAADRAAEGRCARDGVEDRSPPRGFLSPRSHAPTLLLSRAGAAPDRHELSPPRPRQSPADSRRDGHWAALLRTGAHPAV